MSGTGWKRLGLAVGAPIVLLVAYFWLGLWITYSQGDRAGLLQSVRRTGRLCKTNEGELAMTTVPGVMPVIWNFSVRDDEVIPKLRDALGKQVTLRYSEHRYLPTNCFGETRFFVEDVLVSEGDRGAR
jgi:hypothetical protein